MDVKEDEEVYHAYFFDDEEATRHRQYRWEARELTATLLTHIQPLIVKRAVGDVVYADEVRDAQGMRGKALRAFLRARHPPKYPMPATQRDLDAAQNELQELHRYAIQRPVTGSAQQNALPLPRSLQMLLSPQPAPAPLPAALVELKHQPPSPAPAHAHDKPSWR